MNNINGEIMCTKILVLDDEKAIRLSLQDYLEDEGYEVDSVEDAESALTLVQKNEYDLVIVDIRLPGMDGSEFILKANAIVPQLKYIIHTGSVQFSLNEKLKKIGMNDEDVLYKPLKDLDIIIDKINSLIAKN